MDKIIAQDKSISESATDGIGTPTSIVSFDQNREKSKWLSSE